MALPSGLATSFPAESVPADTAAASDPDILIMVENGAGAGPFVLLCDHASNRVPDEYKSFGFAAGQLGLHIAWDPGALGVARLLSGRLDAPLFWPDISRLVIDCNRSPRHLSTSSRDVARLRWPAPPLQRARRARVTRSRTLRDWWRQRRTTHGSKGLTRSTLKRPGIPTSAFSCARECACRTSSYL